LLAIEKWESSYNSTISSLTSKCGTLLSSKVISCELGENKPDCRKEL
jgi:hypothetical protein